MGYNFCGCGELSVNLYSFSYELDGSILISPFSGLVVVRVINSLSYFIANTELIVIRRKRRI